MGFDRKCYIYVHEGVFARSEAAKEREQSKTSEKRNENVQVEGTGEIEYGTQGVRGLRACCGVVRVALPPMANCIHLEL